MEPHPTQGSGTARRREEGLAQKDHALAFFPLGFWKLHTVNMLRYKPYSRSSLAKIVSFIPFSL